MFTVCKHSKLLYLKKGLYDVLEEVVVGWKEISYEATLWQNQVTSGP